MTTRLIALLLASALLSAQEQATTLSRLAGQAAIVATARVLGSDAAPPDLLRVEFGTTAILHGAVSQRFVLLEPAGLCCGNALQQLLPGIEYLLFLERRGPLLHPLGGDRGVMPAEGAVLEHVRALLAAGDAIERAELLAAALDSATPRIAADAALALAMVPDLPRSSRFRDRVLAAMTRELDRASAHAPALVDAAIRIGGPDATARLVAHYLTEQRSGPRRLLTSGLQQLDGEAVRQSLLVQLPADATGRLRVAELLLAIPSVQNRPLLDRLLAEDPPPRLQLALAEAMLVAGVPLAELRARMPAPVLELAERRRSAPPTFRNLPPR